MIKRTAYVACFVAMLGASTALLYFAFAYFSVAIIVENHSSDDISNVVVEYNGGPTELGNVPAGQSRSVRVRAKGDSGVRLKYTVRGKQLETEEFGYFGRHYHGEIVLTLNADGKWNAAVEATP